MLKQRNRAHNKALYQRDRRDQHLSERNTGAAVFR
jgi:hypothetical protein